MGKRQVIASDTCQVNPTTYVVGTNAVPIRRVLVMDPTNHGFAKLPAVTTPEQNAFGVSFADASDKGGNLEYQYLGIAEIESDGSGVINPGDKVIVGALGDGRIKTHTLAVGDATLYQTIGTCIDDAQIAATAGAVVNVLLWVGVLSTGA